MCASLFAAAEQEWSVKQEWTINEVELMDKVSDLAREQQQFQKYVAPNRPVHRFSFPCLSVTPHSSGVFVPP